MKPAETEKIRIISRRIQFEIIGKPHQKVDGWHSVALITLAGVRIGAATATTELNRAANEATARELAQTQWPSWYGRGRNW